VILLKPLLFYFVIAVAAISVLTSIALIPIFGEELEWKSTNVTTESMAHTMEPIHNFNIQYRILNGTGTLQVHDYAFAANTYSKTSGTFELKIPRNFPYYNGKDGPSNVEKYIIIKNGINITRSEYIKTSDCFFTYSVPFYMNSTIKILSTDTLLLVTPIYGDKVPVHCMSETMIPEFPFAVPVLLVSVISLVLFYRIKFKTSI
jgi:hypothetical protein